MLDTILHNDNYNREKKVRVNWLATHGVILTGSDF